MKFKNLTNSELYQLVMDKNLPADQREAAENEFKKRNLNFAQLDALAMEHKKSIQAQKQEELTITTKLRIIFFPFLIPIQGILANKYIKTGEIRKWNEYWKFVAYGFLFWSIIIILLAKFFLFQPA